MRKVLSVATLAAAAAVAWPAAALAAPGDCRGLVSGDDPPVPTGVTVCRSDAWFHAGSARVSNAPNGGTPSWNTTKSTATFQSGGAVYAGLRPIDIASANNPAGRPTFTGTYTGALDNIALTVFNSSVYTALGGSNALYTRLVIDGKEVWLNAASADPEIAVAQQPVDSTTSSMSFAFTNLATTLKILKVPNGPAAVHTISVSFINKYYGDSNFVMFYDATEYPSGVVFNLEPDPDYGSLSGYTEIDTDA